VIQVAICPSDSVKQDIVANSYDYFYIDPARDIFMMDEEGSELVPEQTSWALLRALAVANVERFWKQNKLGRPYQWGINEGNREVIWIWKGRDLVLGFRG